MCFCGSYDGGKRGLCDPQKSHGGGKRGLCKPQKTHEPQKVPPCVVCDLHEPQNHTVEANVVYVNHQKYMVDPFVVHVFFVVHMNHKKHMMEAYVAYVNRNHHMVDPYVVYVFFVVSHKPHLPPRCDFCGSHKPRLPPSCKPQKHINHIFLHHANQKFHINHKSCPHVFSLPLCEFTQHDY